MPPTVFFSWQSTRPGRNFIDKALQSAIDRISQDLTLEEAEREKLVLDRDTKNVPGSPAIFETILKKIANSAIFVADVTFVGQSIESEPLPNPNVMFEYGYALRVLGENRIVAVMNTAHGKMEDLPFDLKTKRFPEGYELPDDASDEERAKVRRFLSKALESHLRLILDSDEYLASIPKPPAPPARTYREPLEGRARFRKKGETIGFSGDPTTAFLGLKEWAVQLLDGPASWLRVAPVTPPSAALSVADIKAKLAGLAILPFYDAGNNILSVRSGDGSGYYREENNGNAISVVFVFRDAEIWAINTWFLSAVPNLIILEADRWAKSLQQCAEFLTNGLQIPGPYHWIAGMEDVSGRMLATNDPMGRKWGPCSDNIIEKDGEFSLGQDPLGVLDDFFREVYEQCGAPVPPRRT
jgi:hypothetical protein